MSPSDQEPPDFLVGTEASRAKIRGCMNRAEYGTSTLASSDDIYSFPMSFGFDDALENLYFLMAFDEGSKKREYLESTHASTFVVESNLPDHWVSILIDGPINPVPSDDSQAAYEALADTAAFPAAATFEKYFDAETIEQSLYSLRIDSLSGRYASTPAE